MHSRLYRDGFEMVEELWFMRLEKILKEEAEADYALKQNRSKNIKAEAD